MNIPLIFLSFSKIETLLDALERQILILPSTKILRAIEMQTAKKPYYATSQNGLLKVSALNTVRSALPSSEHRQVDGKSSLRMRGSFSTKFQVSSWSWEGLNVYPSFVTCPVSSPRSVTRVNKLRL